MNKSINFLKMKYVDLTHALSSTIPHWHEDCGFKHSNILDYKDCEGGAQFRVQKLSLYAGVGTHIDAPSHCVPGGANVDELALDQLIAPLIVLDVSEKVHEAYRAVVEDLHHFEKKYGTIPKSSLVIIHTAWGELWDKPQAYRNDLKYPTVSTELAQLLLDREIVGLGIDTLSPDGPDDDFPVHRLILTSGKYIIENVANAHLVPPTGAYSIALPLKIEGATESPIRLIALVPKDKA